MGKIPEKKAPPKDRPILDRSFILKAATQQDDREVYEPPNAPLYQVEVFVPNYNIWLMVDPPNASAIDGKFAEPLAAGTRRTILVLPKIGRPFFSIGVRNRSGTPCTVYVRSYKWYDDE